MSDGRITLFWGDGDNTFRIAIGEFRELQERILARRAAMGLGDIGPQDFSNALRRNNVWPDDVRDVLRVGLVGAGMKPADANRKLVQYFDRRPPSENYLTAFAVFAAAFAGAPGDDMIKKKTETTSPIDQSSFPNSTAMVP